MGDLDADTWAANVRELWKGANQGGDFRTNYQSHTDSELAAALRQNLFVFAAFKNHNMVGDLVGLLTDDSGRLRPFDEFRRLALQVSTDYNTNWLQAEYDTAVASAQMAVRWREMQSRAKALPFLRYVTAGDERVRQSHALLDGVTRRLDDAFWDEWYPPNGWRCRCDVQQVASGETPIPDALKSNQPLPGFSNNPGKSGQVFTLQHPYFQLVKPAQRRNLLKGAARLILENYDAGQYWKDNAPAAARFRALQGVEALGYDTESGGFLVLHRGHMEAALADELPVLLELKRGGAMLELLDEQGSGPRYDLFWDGKFWDLKRMHLSSNVAGTVYDYFRSSARQRKTQLLIHVDQPVALEVLRDALYQASRKRPQINLVQLLWDGRLIRLTPDQMKARTWQ